MVRVEKKPTIVGELPREVVLENQVQLHSLPTVQFQTNLIHSH